MLTAVKFLLTYVHIVLGRILIILYILTIILVGFSHGVEGWVGFSDKHAYLYETGNFCCGYCVMSAILLYKRMLGDIFCISLNYLYEEASSNPCWLQQILFIHFTSGDNSSDMHKNYLFSVVHTSWPLCRITKFSWIGAVHIVNYAGHVHFFFIWFFYVSCILNN